MTGLATLISGPALARSWPPQTVYFSVGNAVPEADHARRNVQRAIEEGPRQLTAPVRYTDPIRFEVSGHTDRVGTPAANVRLSCARALAVRDVMVRQGIPPEHIDVFGFGESRPKVETQDGESEPMNRRVEIDYGPYSPDLPPRGNCIDGRVPGN